MTHPPRYYPHTNGAATIRRATRFRYSMDVLDSVLVSQSGGGWMEGVGMDGWMDG